MRVDQVNVTMPDGEIALATIMSATASFDHRAIDGAVAAEFMAAFKSLMENPLLIVGSIQVKKPRHINFVGSCADHRSAPSPDSNPTQGR